MRWPFVLALVASFLVGGAAVWLWAGGSCGSCGSGAHPPAPPEAGPSAAADASPTGRPDMPPPPDVRPVPPGRIVQLEDWETPGGSMEDGVEQALQDIESGTGMLLATGPPKAAVDPETGLPVVWLGASGGHVPVSDMYVEGYNSEMRQAVREGRLKPAKPR